METSERLANRLFLACRDMDDARRYLLALQEMSELQSERGSSEYFDHCEAITVAAIVAYCRSFKRSRTEGKADALLDPDALNLFGERPELQALHERLVERRDRAVAHGDWEYHKTEVVNRNYKGGVLRKSPSPNLIGGIPMDEFLELVEHVAQRCLYRGFELDRHGPQPGGA